MTVNEELLGALKPIATVDMGGGFLRALAWPLGDEVNPTPSQQQEQGQ